MFQYFLLSITVAPILLGVSVANVGDAGRERQVLRVAWIAYVALWFATLYYLRSRWL